MQLPEGNVAATSELSIPGAVVNMLKYLIGLGIMSLPHATTHVGWLLSLIGFSIVAFLTVAGIELAIMTRERFDSLELTRLTVQKADGVLDRESSKQWEDFPDYGLGFFDKIVGKLFGSPAQCVFVGCIALGQFTTVVLYIDVIVVNIGSYFGPGAQVVGVPIRNAALIGLAGFLCALCLIKTLQGVAVLSGLGLSIYTFIFAGLTQELFAKVNSGTLPPTVFAVHPDKSIGDWFGTSCFAFAGFPLAIVMYDEIRDRKSFRFVTSVSFTICWIVYSLFAVVGYLCFGANTDMLINLNFKPGSLWREGSAAALAGVLTFSVSVQAMPLFACMTIFYERMCLDHRIEMDESRRLFIRWAIIAASVTFAYFVPSIKFLMNTLGAVTGVFSGFFFPACAFLAASSSGEIKERLLAVLVISVGALGLFYSTRESLQSIT